MSIYISLLRGINVSGQKKVNMKDLKALYKSLNLQQVKTYIQSGNVVFSSDKSSIDELSKMIETAIVEKFGFSVPVLILSAKELKAALNELPFKSLSLQDQGSQVIFSFLSKKVTEESLTLLKSYISAGEQIDIPPAEPKVIYLHCPNGYGKTKLSNTFIEKKLSVISTSRNLKTVTKLCNLASECSK